MPKLEGRSQWLNLKFYSDRFLYGFLILLFHAGTLFSYEKDQYVDFSPFLSCSFSSAVHDAGALPLYVDYSKKEFVEVFAEFIRGDELDQISSALEKWHSEFLASPFAFAWEKSRYRFGIFGSKQSTHKKTRLIEGINCKMCREYCDWILEQKGEEIKKIPGLSTLIYRLIQIDEISHKIFIEKVAEISLVHPEINQIFYSYKGASRLPISIRLIRFERSERFTLPLHFDISVMSLIFPSDDDPLDECLIIAPADGSEFAVENLMRAMRPAPRWMGESSALLISGTLLSYLNIPILPTPHGVIPHNRDSRCVIVACLHVPNLDTSEQTTLLPQLSDVPDHLKNRK